MTEARGRYEREHGQDPGQGDAGIPGSERAAG
ncbi:hypothetical protein STENM327S_05935 [Streptomyces tendae]